VTFLFTRHSGATIILPVIPAHAGIQYLLNDVYQAGAG
jgi:hypothetical protein